MTQKIIFVVLNDVALIRSVCLEDLSVQQSYKSGMGLPRAMLFDSDISILEGANKSPSFHLAVQTVPTRHEICNRAVPET